PGDQYPGDQYPGDEYPGYPASDDRDYRRYYETDDRGYDEGPDDPEYLLGYDGDYPASLIAGGRDDYPGYSSVGRPSPGRSSAGRPSPGRHGAGQHGAGQHGADDDAPVGKRVLGRLVLL